MEAPRASDSGAVVRILAIMLGISAMVVLVVMLGRTFTNREAAAAQPPIAAAPASPPIVAEAAVFRLSPEDVAVAPGTGGRPQAHFRTLARFRTLRAYPGAPPRIPHGLTSDEFRETTCNVCHERGGWARRFGAYAPVTPHPDLGSCLQCHVPDDRVVGLAPDAFGGELCLQCHVPGEPAPTFVTNSWRPAEWPVMNRRALAGSPPTIPHELDLRGNCLACHMGAAAVEEIRTDHPERANCRQCHVRVEAESAFTRPRADSATPAGGEP